jgi:hypothetical protein
VTAFQLAGEQQVFLPHLAFRPPRGHFRLNFIVLLLRDNRRNSPRHYYPFVAGDVFKLLPANRDCASPSINQLSVYDDIREKLCAMGMKPSEIAFIHDADTDARKEAMFAAVRSGQIRVILGSTQKMGAGTNAQKRLIALHHLDCPYRPSDLEQRDGRIVRQGNDNPEVRIYQYVTKNSFVLLY